MDVKDLIKLIKAGATVNVDVTVGADGSAGTDVQITQQPDCDFEVGDNVLVCHIRKDGSRVHCYGEVTEIDQDDKGWYVRVTGDNGKHYRCGMHYNEERLGSMIVELDD